MGQTHAQQHDAMTRRHGSSFAGIHIIGAIVLAVTVMMLATSAGDASAAAEQREVIAAACASDQSTPDATLQSPSLTPPDAAVPQGGERSEVLTVVLAGVSAALIIATHWYRLHRAPARPVAFTTLSALLLLALMMMLGSIGFGLARMGTTAASQPAATTPTLTDSVRLALGVTLARALGVVAYIILLRQARPPAPDRRASPGRALAVAVAGLLLVWPLVQASILLAGWIMNAPPGAIAHETLRQLAGAPIDKWWLAMMALVIVAAPVTEEIMYRGLLQEGLRRAGFGPWAAIALASGVFALAHVGAVQPHALVGLFVLALGLGWSYEKTGTLWASIAMHALFNAGNLLLART